MYSFTKNLSDKQHKILVQCECTRNYIAEEMYCCLSCSQVFCRFCTTNEIYCNYCRQCNDTIFPQDMVTIKTHCQNCFECPSCKHVLIQAQDTSDYLFFYCMYCFWSSKQIDVVDKKQDQLYAKLQNENRKILEPMHQEFIRFNIKLKEIEVELKNKRQVKKIEKVFIRQYSQRQKNLVKFTIKEAEQKQIDNQLKTLQIRYNLELSSNQINMLNSSDNIKFHIYQKAYKPWTELEMDKDINEFSDSNFSKTLSIDQRIRQQSIMPSNNPKTLIPNHSTHLTKKNRKCRKCASTILKFEKVKDNKFVQNITSFLWYLLMNYHISDHCPSLTLVVTKINDDYSVKITFQNKTKQNLDAQLSPLPAQFKEQLLLEIKDLPDQLMNLPAQDIEVTTVEKQQQAAQKNSLEFTVLHNASIPITQKANNLPQMYRFGFMVDVTIEINDEKKKVSYPTIIQLAK